MDKEKTKKLNLMLCRVGVPNIVRKKIFKYADEYIGINDLLECWEETIDENRSNVLLNDLLGLCFEINLSEGK